MPSSCRIKRGNTHQTMHAVLCFEIAESIAPCDLEGRTFDTCFFAWLEVEDVVRIPMRLCPTDVHAQQHVRPVLRFCASCPGMDGQQSISRIHLSAQQRFQLKMFNFQGKLRCLNL